jgi:hypothetical protein
VLVSARDHNANEVGKVSFFLFSKNLVFRSF